MLPIPPPPHDLPAALPALSGFRFQLRGFLAFSESAAEALGTTSQQYQLLQVVGEAAAPGVSITRIAERLLLRHNSAVELVDRAQRAGLVLRATDTADARRLLVTLTEKGRGLLAQLVERHLEFLGRAGDGLLDSLASVLGEIAARAAKESKKEEPVC